MRQYKARCKGCGKIVKDPEDDPIYLVRDDEYWCSQECIDGHPEQ
jgi:hypothetical protein